MDCDALRDAPSALPDQPIVYPPRGQPLSIGKTPHPGAGHILETDSGRLTVGPHAQIDDVVAIDLAGAQNAGIDAMGKTPDAVCRKGAHALEPRKPRWSVKA